MLPYNPKDIQQIARKKHIGNDVVVFIFMMGRTPFDPSSFVSEFNHVFIAVKRESDGYHINVVSRVSSPSHCSFTTWRGEVCDAFI
jgi:RAP1 GTPase activating protein 1